MKNLFEKFGFARLVLYHCEKKVKIRKNFQACDNHALSRARSVSYCQTVNYAF